MRLFGFRLPFFVATFWMGIGSTVWALGLDDELVETAYVVPSVSTVTVPTSYVTATSWVQPTAYVSPSYYATAYWGDPLVAVRPTYVSQTYVRTGLFGRRWLVERPVLATAATSYSYLPTSYYVPTTYYRTRTYVPTVVTAPTVWPSTYLAATDCVCPEVALAPSRSASTAVTAPRGGAESRGRSLQSEPAEEGAMNSNVSEPPPSAATGTATRPGPGEPNPAADANAAAGVSNNDTTPTPPTVPRTPPNEPAKAPATLPPASATPAAGQTNPPGGAGSSPTPTAPGGPNTLNFPPPEAKPPGDEVRRDAQKPALPVPTTIIRPELRNVLFGVVQSSAAEPEEGVRVTITNPSNGALYKAPVTNAFGRFSVRLRDGAWTVNVTMPSGRVYPVSHIRVRDGQIIDSQGRRVPSLEITR